MSRVTKEDLAQVENVINSKLERNGYKVRVVVQYAYGRPRVHWTDELGYPSRDLSPRLPSGELYRWLCAFDAGLSLGIDGPA